MKWRASLASRLVLGTVDFMVDSGMQCDMQETQLTQLRFATTVASRRFWLSAPVDGVTLGINDGERLRQDTLRALQFGFGAKLCILQLRLKSFMRHWLRRSRN